MPGLVEDVGVDGVGAARLDEPAAGVVRADGLGTGEQGRTDQGALPTRREHRRQAATRGDATCGEYRQRRRLEHLLQQRQGADPAGVPTGLVALRDHRVDTRRLDDPQIVDRVDLREHHGPCLVDPRDVGCGIAERERDQLRPVVEHGGEEAVVVGERPGHQAESDRSASDLAGGADLPRDPLGGVVPGGADEAETAGTGHLAGEPPAGPSTHGRAQQGNGDSEFTGEPGVEHANPSDGRRSRDGYFFGLSDEASDESAATNASCGTSTRPIVFIRFLPSFCFSSSLRLRLMSPP